MRSATLSNFAAGDDEPSKTVNRVHFHQQPAFAHEIERERFAQGFISHGG